MVRRGTVALIATLVFLMVFVSVHAQQPMKGWKGSSGWGQGATYNRIYNPATIETVSGEVVAVEQITPAKGMSAGIHLQLKTDKETVSVHLGPAWYIERLDTKLEKGDKVEVTGSRVTFAGAPAVIAAQVKKGDAVLKLRDDNGFPVWAGWKR